MKNKHQYYLKPSIYILLILFLFIVFGLLTQSIIVSNRNHYENVVTEVVANDIQSDLDNYINKMSVVERFVTERLDSGIDYDDFYLFASGLFQNDKALDNISIAPNAIHEFVYPSSKNDILGYNLLEDARSEVVDVVTHARDNNVVVISGPYPMRTNSEINIIVIRYPIYYANGDFYGLINVVIKTSLLFESSYSEQNSDFLYNVIDDANNILYGEELEYPLENKDPIDLKHFEWRLVFGKSESYYRDYEDTVRYANIGFLTSIFVLLIAGIIFVYAKYKAELEKIAAKKELVFASYHDSLTGLYNRRYFEENIPFIDTEENYPLTVIVSDINGLKLINDAFGHSAGDELLIQSANKMRNVLSKIDLIARIGGDEFVILAPKTTSREAEELILKIKDEIKDVSIKSIKLSISFGYNTKNTITESIEEIYRSAEDSMYRVKLNEIPSMRSSAIETILGTLYEKDPNSEIHSRAVSLLSKSLAKELGLSNQQVYAVETAGLLHDIGKIIIPTSILVKEGNLTDEEYETIMSHPEIGFRILNSTHDMRVISTIVLSHHEKWDGTGYPRGIKGEGIPLESRIIAIADTFDAMISERSYREKYSLEDALKEIERCAGTQFDPEIAKVFVQNFESINNDINK